MNLEIAGEQLTLSAERALYRPATRQLLVADPHFGKAEVFRTRGIPVPEGTTDLNLARLDRLVARHEPQHIVFLGDFLHARVSEVFASLIAWRRRHAGIAMTLVRGNHDARAGALPAELELDVVAVERAEIPFVYRHAPDPSPHGFTLAGHLHPAYRLRGRGRESLRLPCFWMTRAALVLPAFGEFTGCMDIERGAGDRVFLVADDRVVEAPEH